MKIGKIGKTAAFAASALLAVNSVSALAYAEEKEEYSLISAPISEIAGTKSLNSIGGGYYICYDENGTAFKMVYIGDGEISEWRETGEFVWKNTECDFDIENYYFCSPKPSGDGKYFGIALTSDRDRFTHYYYCESSDDHTKITAKPFDTSWAHVRPDGYSFAVTGGTCYIGKGTELNEIDMGYTSGAGHLALDFGEYVCGMFYWTDPLATVKRESPYDDERFYYAALCLADKDGNVNEMYRTPEPREDNYCSYVSWPSGSLSGEALQWRENYMKDGVETRFHKIYCFRSGELLTFPYNDILPDGRNAWYVELEDGVFNGRAIMNLTLQDSGNYAALVDTETGEYVSDVYESLTTRDGEHFLANDENGWTLIDGDGNRLCDFDDVTEFYGGMAMACENGEGFIIDGNMEKISGTVPAESAFMGVNENIFIARRNGEYYFVTYVKDGADTENPATGNISVFTLVICMAVSGSAVIKTGRSRTDR
ncbi:MAG: hypothetical protein NC395_07775 [Prevotella sp.]|nr:hypothetical protein [Prevotella sp.]